MNAPILHSITPPGAGADAPGTASTTAPRPKRPLCAYNIFFQEQRKILLANRPVRPEGAPRNGHGKIGFSEMAKTIAAMWKVIPPEPKKRYERMAKREKARYDRALAIWKGEEPPSSEDDLSSSSSSSSSSSDDDTEDDFYEKEDIEIDPIAGVTADAQQQIQLHYNMNTQQHGYHGEFCYSFLPAAATLSLPPEQVHSSIRYFGQQGQHVLAQQTPPVSVLYSPTSAFGEQEQRPQPKYVEKSSITTAFSLRCGQQNDHSTQIVLSGQSNKNATAQMTTAPAYRQPETVEPTLMPCGSNNTNSVLQEKPSFKEESSSEHQEQADDVCSSSRDGSADDEQPSHLNTDHGDFLNTFSDHAGHQDSTNTRASSSYPHQLFTKTKNSSGGSTSTAKKGVYRVKHVGLERLAGQLDKESLDFFIDLFVGPRRARRN
ncbi:hypothetical protein ACA910_002800 [Epithemia clementina (nom. ined.)]